MIQQAALIRSGLIGLALSVSACAVGPDYERPALDVPQAWTASAPEGAPISGGAWWTGFEDPVLDALVEAALDGNVDIAAASERLLAAEALAGAARSDLFPTLDGGVSGRADTSGNDTASASLGMAFTPDVNGATRRSIERARARLAARGYELEDVRRLTVASVAQRYVELRRTRARLALLDTSLDLQARTLNIVERRREAGLAADLDVQRATADLARTRAQRGLLLLSETRSLNALSILLGRPPEGELAAFGLAEAGRDADTDLMLQYEGAPAAGLPADLLRSRPDLRAAEAELVAATAAIGIETADLYPGLRLPGSITADLDGSAADDVVAAISAVVDIPLFDAGRRRAEVRAAEANAREAALAYRRALLEALGEVETAFVAIESYEARRADYAEAVSASEEAFAQLNALYREGLASLTDVLDGQRTLISSREAYVDSEADLAAAVIDLNRVLAAPF